MGAVAAAGSLALSPALAAMLGAASGEGGSSSVSLKMLGSIASFTPVTNDERLAQAYAKAARESQSRGFRFTPSSGSINGRSLTILVRAGALSGERKASERVLPNLGVAPVAYRLGTTKGLERFSTGARLDPAIPDPVIETKLKEPLPNYTLRAKKDRFSTNLELQERDGLTGTPADEAPQTLAGERSYAVDISSSYSLTRNLNLRAGVRYKGPSNRLAPVVTDQTQDSQAVYVGTTFKF
jgi:hypothetical protein